MSNNKAQSDAELIREQASSILDRGWGSAEQLADAKQLRAIADRIIAPELENMTKKQLIEECNSLASIIADDMGIQAAEARIEELEEEVDAFVELEGRIEELEAKAGALAKGTSGHSCGQTPADGRYQCGC